MQTLGEHATSTQKGPWTFGIKPVPPVDDATGVNLHVSKISQQPLLHLDQVHRSAVGGQLTHAAQEAAEGVGALPATGYSRAA